MLHRHFMQRNLHYNLLNIVILTTHLMVQTKLAAANNASEIHPLASLETKVQS